MLSLALFLTLIATYSSANTNKDGDAAASAAASAAAATAAGHLSRPDVIGPEVLEPNQASVPVGQAGPGHCRLADSIFSHGQLIKTTLACYKVRCGAGRLHWVVDTECCVGSEAPGGIGGGGDAAAAAGSRSPLLPPGTRQSTPEVCQFAVCDKGRWTVQPDAENCCEHERRWYPIGSTRPMQGGPCTYQLCHEGRWERHYNTTCCFDTIGWHTDGTVLFTSDPCRTKTCRNAQWSKADSCCWDSTAKKRVATGDLVPIDECRYRLCQETHWSERTAFGCCERHGQHYEHGAVVNVGGSWCGRDRCVDGAWHVTSRRRVGDARCRLGWGRLGRRCVIRSDKSRTYAEAEEWCREHGGYLMSILNKDHWKHAEKAGNSTVWIGLRGFESPAGGRLLWRWDDGTPRTVHVLWAHHQPRLHPAHRCAYIQHGRAVSAACDERHSAYCATTDCRIR